MRGGRRSDPGEQASFSSHQSNYGQTSTLRLGPGMLDRKLALARALHNVANYDQLSISLNGMASIALMRASISLTARASSAFAGLGLPFAKYGSIIVSRSIASWEFPSPPARPGCGGVLGAPVGPLSPVLPGGLLLQHHRALTGGGSSCSCSCNGPVDAALAKISPKKPALHAICGCHKTRRLAGITPRQLASLRQSPSLLNDFTFGVELEMLFPPTVERREVREALQEVKFNGHHWLCVPVSSN
jgi:hypothetical protein